jgi:hypothetical protein
MKVEEGKIATPTTESKEPTPFWGSFIIDILKKLLEFNQLPSGIKKKF